MVWYYEAMRLYLSSIFIPTPDELSRLIGKPLNEVSVALIPNAQDYYSERARQFKIKESEISFSELDLKVETVDLRNYSDLIELKSKLKAFDLIWARGGNTFCLRYEMQRSGFGGIINELVNSGVVYGGDSAGALAAGVSLVGIELVDKPEYAELVITEGLNLVPFVVLPHIDNPMFTEAVAEIGRIHTNKHNLIRLKDNQAVIFDDNKHWISEAI